LRCSDRRSHSGKKVAHRGRNSRFTKAAGAHVMRLFFTTGEAIARNAATELKKYHE
jgi:hypothetical protein